MMRFFTVYGPCKDQIWLYTHSQIKLLKKTLSFNKGKMSRDFTYIDDVVKSVILLIKKTNSELQEKKI